MSNATWASLAASAEAKLAKKQDHEAIEAQILREEIVANLFANITARGWTEMATSSLSASVEGGGIYRPERRGMSSIMC